MAHQVESMMYAGATPWHGLGKKIADEIGYSIPASLRESGLDWTVGKEQTYCFIDGKQTLVPDCYAVVRSNDKKILGNVGSRYHLLQNHEAFEWFSPYLETRQARFETAGSLKEGSRIWVQAKLNLDPMEVVKGDVVEKYILLAHAHDGSLKIRAGFTPIRVVCANTLAMANGSDASKLLSVKHSKNMKENLEAIRNVMNVANSEFEATLEQYKLLARKQFKQAELDKYLRIVIGVPEKGELPTRTKNKLETLVEYVVSGKGNAENNVFGTYWGAYNGVTEYLSYEAGRNVDNRMNNLWFGPESVLNRKALQVALDMAA